MVRERRTSRRGLAKGSTTVHRGRQSGQRPESSRYRMCVGRLQSPLHLLIFSWRRRTNSSTFSVSPSHELFPFVERGSSLLVGCLDRYPITPPKGSYYVSFGKQSHSAAILLF